MKFKKVIVQFDAENLILAEELIIDIFFSFNLKGVVCNIPLDEPDEGFGTDTLPKPEIYSIEGFLPLIDSSDILLEQIRVKTSNLSHLNIKTDIKIKNIDILKLLEDISGVKYIENKPDTDDEDNTEQNIDEDNTEQNIDEISFK